MNNNSHPIDNLLKNTMQSLKELVDVDTIVGTPFNTDDGSTIIPISKVSLGFASGGSEFSNNSQNHTDDSSYPFGGGSGAGVSVKPVAFLILKGETFRMLPLNSENTADRIIDSVPQILDIIKNMCPKCDKNSKDKDKKNKDRKDKETCKHENNSCYDYEGEE
ncbi:GerW family sporulation protein [Hathewaya limosa]|uniref:Sporulation protein YtfJ n=1 Tax=Hathewaya limosa TaxID=1536 RepID=A0ABU0JRS1_HATLI|nr:GerW family sporulation protein [Hathewaya limosa]MDQ0479759.1 sporulation protein YtfJ [Hathewaya limosa]